MTDYFQRSRRFVLSLSGAHLPTLDLVPTERARFESLGWAILITSGVATVSMWFALASAVGINGFLAFPVAVFWGLAIMGIDRWLVNSIPVDENRKWTIAVPRVLLAILLGTLISTPIVLRVFESEINAQIAKQQASNYNAYLQTQRNGQLAKQIATYNTELQYLNTIISSHGVSTGGTAADPQLVTYNKQLSTLTGQLATWTRLQGRYYQAYICQLYGGPTCPKKGNGPAAKTSKQNYDNATTEVATIKGQINHVQQEIQARDRQLNDNSATGQRNRYQQALTQRPTVQAEYNTAVQQQNQLQQSYYAQNQASHGILVRLEALSQLSNSNFTVAAARFLLFLLFLVIECLPVTVKLLQKPGHYEAALKRARRAESRDVEMFYSSWSGYQDGPPPVLTPPAQPRPAEPRPTDLRHGDSRQADSRQSEPVSAGRGPLSDVFGIWNATKEMDRPVGDPQDEQGTGTIDERDRPDFPPSESDPRSSHGWRQTYTDPAQGNAGQDEPGHSATEQGDQNRGGQGGNDTAEEVSAASAWPGHGYPDPDNGFADGVPHHDAFQQAFTPPHGLEHAGDDMSLHEALRQVEGDEPAPAHADTDGDGILLNWDDE